MRIVFMGTPQFALPSLARLLADGHQIPAVFTQPDKPKGRGYTLMPSPVKTFALEKGLNVYQPRTLRDGESEKILKDLAPDCIVVVAYGKILPKSILDIPAYGCINVHASLLPKLRGAAPIQWAVINGEKETGVTIMQMGEGLDTGDMLLVRRTEIGEAETSGDLFTRLAEIGAEALSDALKGMTSGEITPVPQLEERASYAPMLSKEMCWIDWNQSALQVHNLVRGLSPFLAASTRSAGKVLKIHKTSLVPQVDTSGKCPGEILIVDKTPCVVCGEGAVALEEIQLEGKKRVKGCDFIRGNNIHINETSK